MIDWNVRIGDLVIMVSAGAAALSFIFKSGTLMGNVTTLQKDIEELQATTKEIAGVLIKVAVQQETINSMTRRQDRIETNFEDLRRGKGFISVPVAQVTHGENS